MTLQDDAALIFGSVYLISGFIAAYICWFFYRQEGDGRLRNILMHLLFSWSGHYIVIGMLSTLIAFWGRDWPMFLPVRILGATFVLIQLHALVRLYRYIKRNRG